LVRNTSKNKIKKMESYNNQYHNNHHHHNSHQWRAAGNLTQEEINHSQHSWWGPLDASLDWCENNFEYTYAIAEFFNTLTVCQISNFLYTVKFYHN
jgi:hypothetical protein